MPTALVTGGTSGIGRATAELLHRRGHRVAVTGADPTTLETVRRELPDGVLVVRADARSLTDTDRAVKEVVARLGPLDLLFLNAGVLRPEPVADVTEESFDEQVDVNFKGQFFTLQRALPHLRDGGSVVLTVGVAARRAAAGAAIGAASRGALLAMLPTLAVELAPRRIRVNAVSPGATDTPLLDKLGVPGPDRERLSRSVPLGRLGTPADVAETVLFLASDAAAYVTGQELTVSGGLGL